MYREGDKWDAMTITAIEIEDAEQWAEDADGNRYVADTQPTRVVRLQCDCGSPVVTVPLNKFRKREHKDCGCGRAWGEAKVVTSFQLPISLKEHLDNVAQHKRMSRNQVIISALTQFFSASANQNNSSTSKQDRK